MAFLTPEPFGATGLSVPPLGLGAGQVGDEALSDAEAGDLLNLAVDLGVLLIDTARGYGRSEWRIGRYLSSRRDEVVLTTKVGYDVPGCQDWTYEAVIGGVDRARAQLRCDTIDIVHLHSCDLEVLRTGAVIDALDEARSRGWLRVGAYSGEGAALDWAVDSGRFASIECSVNLCDQQVLDGAVARAAANGMGVIAKRPLANAPWRYSTAPHGLYVEPYWHRWQALGWQQETDFAGLPPDEVALRFAAFARGINCAIAGTASQANLRRNVAAVQHGPLPAGMAQALKTRFHAVDPGDWVGQL